MICSNSMQRQPCRDTDKLHGIYIMQLVDIFRDLVVQALCYSISEFVTWHIPFYESRSCSSFAFLAFSWVAVEAYTIIRIRAVVCRFHTKIVNHLFLGTHICFSYCYIIIACRVPGMRSNSILIWRSGRLWSRIVGFSAALDDRSHVAECCWLHSCFLCVPELWCLFAHGLGATSVSLN